MDNTTYSVMIHFLPFSIHNGNKSLIFTIFFFIYLMGIIVNISITMVIFVDSHLHRPMYLFLTNLSLSDITFTTAVVPKLLYMTLSGNYTVSLTQCLIQFYFYLIAGTVEDMVLLIMAYDRYVAICQPLYYQHRLSKRICVLLIAAIWLSACINAIIVTHQVSQLFFYHSVTVHHFLCELKFLFHAGYGGFNKHFLIIIFTELFIFGIPPFSYIFWSYVKIILLIKNTEGRKKAFSTCSSHLIVMMIYYCCAIVDFMIPTSENTRILEQVLSMFYTSVIPILNPIIYSLRNNEIKKALQRLVRKKRKY